MSLPLLQADALRSLPAGFELHLNLPWIRSLPLSSVSEIRVDLDGRSIDGLRVSLDGRDVPLSALSEEAGWWFVQDRLVVRGAHSLNAGTHQVSVSLRLVIPYLQAGPAGPLDLGFADERGLTADADAPIASTRPREASAPADSVPDDRWEIAASAFNWTPDVIRAERPAPDIAVGIVADGVARVIELEPGQLWRSFPDPLDAEVDALRTSLAEVGGSVSIVGASLDDWISPDRRRDDDERFAFVVPQLRAAHRVGAQGVRLPIGQAGTPLLRRLLPVLEQNDLVLFEEIQGQQTPDAAGTAPAIEAIAEIDDPRVRLLVDISMLMPQLPVTYLDRLRSGGIDPALVDRLAGEWHDAALTGVIVGYLRSGAVPPALHTMYMNLLIRFGRSHASVLRGVLPLIGAFHLKFWDLDDTDGRVSTPIRDLGAELSRVDWRGSLTSEWGGHEWLDDDPTETTRAHLSLARDALRVTAPSV